MIQLSYGDQDVLALVEKVLYGFLIQKAWQVSPADLHPIVMFVPLYPPVPLT